MLSASEFSPIMQMKPFKVRLIRAALSTGKETHAILIPHISQQTLVDMACVVVWRRSREALLEYDKGKPWNRVHLPNLQEIQLIEIGDGLHSTIVSDASLIQAVEAVIDRQPHPSITDKERLASAIMEGNFLHCLVLHPTSPHTNQGSHSTRTLWQACELTCRQ